MVGYLWRVAVLMLLGLGVPGLVSAQTAREDVAAQLKVVTDVKADAGYQPDTTAFGRSTFMGVLEQGGSVYLELALQAGRDYHIAARCDSGCRNVDLRVLSPDFDPLAEDVLDNDAPKVDVVSTATGPHLLGVQMTACAEKICYFGVVVLSKTSK